MGEPHLRDEPLVVWLLSDELAVERLRPLQQLAPERLRLRHVRADALLVAVGGDEQLSHRLGRKAEVALGTVAFAARDAVQPEDAERDDEEECREASREHQPPQPGGSPLRAHAIALPLAEVEELHGAIERVAVSPRPRRSRPILTAPSQAELQLRVVPQPGGSLAVPRRFARQTRIQGCGRALLLGPCR